MRDHSAKGSVVRVISADSRSRTGVVEHAIKMNAPEGANRPGRVQSGIQRRPVRWPDPPEREQSKGTNP